MKIIFLDIDGVLNNRGCYYQGNIDQYGRKPDPACIAALNQIVEATGAHVVVSSTWRLGRKVVDLRETLGAWGATCRVVDKTPFIPGEQRGREIQTWLNCRKQDRGDVESFVILDDDADMIHLLPNLVKTNYETGLTMEHADRAIALLEAT